jgi:hypothetical protein
MTANISYLELNTRKEITFDAYDMETIKKAVIQWQRNEFRLKGRQIKILNIRQEKD